MSTMATGTQISKEINPAIPANIQKPVAKKLEHNVSRAESSDSVLRPNLPDIEIDMVDTCMKDLESLRLTRNNTSEIAYQAQCMG